jgi:hypothetical protein
MASVTHLQVGTHFGADGDFIGIGYNAEAPIYPCGYGNKCVCAFLFLAHA